MPRHEHRTLVKTLLDAPLKEALVRLARENDRSLAAEVRHASREHVARSNRAAASRETEGTDEGGHA